MRRRAREHGVSLVLMGSRVSGTRLRQRGLHPALPYILPLEGTSRAPSATRAGADAGLKIDKTVIKDFGRESMDSSGLAVVLIDPVRSSQELDTVAIALEREFSRFTPAFPISVFAHIRGDYFKTVDELLASICGKLITKLPTESGLTATDLRSAFSELYAVLRPQQTRR